MKRIGVFTSGGDAPGMNAAIRAVVLAGANAGVEVVGIKYGYEGMINGDFVSLKPADVDGIINRGGTILKSARSKAFRTEEGRAIAAKNLKDKGIEGVVAIGGDGTFTGALVFSAAHDIPFVGIPGTIDNDLFGTDYTLGYDTALNTVIEAVDKIRDTATAHRRLFFVEVMGRDAGFIALRGGIASGAESILIPERPTSVDELIQQIDTDWKGKRESGIIIVAEGDDAGGAYAVAEKVKQRLPEIETRITVLGHVQRGGAPSALDRLLGSQMGVAAVSYLLKGKHNVMVGIVNREVELTPFKKSIKHHTKIKEELLNLAKLLSQPY